jgi:DNA-directed RNA polymerase specialized sigma24 family protein
MLLHVQNLPMAEVARRLGLSLVAAKARLFRARVLLRQQMRQCLGLPAAA